MSRTVVDGKAASSTVLLKLTDYVPSLFRVVLREEGRLTQQSCLTVIRLLHRRVLGIAAVGKQRKQQKVQKVFSGWISKGDCILSWSESVLVKLL